jgi:hypothetical protein
MEPYLLGYILSYFDLETFLLIMRNFFINWRLGHGMQVPGLSSAICSLNCKTQIIQISIGEKLGIVFLWRKAAIGNHCSYSENE